MLHLEFHERGYLLELGPWDLKNELVMDLEQHSSIQIVGGERRMDTDHGHLYQIGGRALDWGIRGRALPEGSDVEVPVAKLVDIAAAIEDRLDVAMLSREFDHRVEVL